MVHRGTPCWGALLLALALPLGGCLGANDDEDGRVRGDAATVYVSVPTAGVSASAGRAVLAGARRALAESDGRAGDLAIRLRALPATEVSDDPEEAQDPWDPDAVSANAERAADDPRAIAYLGELDFGASAVSVPITNGAGLLQLSPADGLTSLTRRPPGRPRAGPERYYPSGRQSFACLCPEDLAEAEAMLDRAAAGGARRIGLVFDRGIYGRELAGALAARARGRGLEPVATEQYGGELDAIPELAMALADAGPDAVLHAGIAGPGTGRLLAAIDAALPGVPLYAASGILARSAPIPAAPDVVEAVGTRTSPARAGYEAMRLLLRAVDEGGRDRARVRAAGLRLARSEPRQELFLYRLGPGGSFVRGARFSPR